MISSILHSQTNFMIVLERLDNHILLRVSANSWLSKATRLRTTYCLLPIRGSLIYSSSWSVQPMTRIMSSNLRHVLDFSKEALTFHSLNSLEECANKLGLIRQNLLQSDRNELDSTVIWNLSAIINGERRKWTDECKPSGDGLEVVAQAFFCLRNAFVNCSRIQLMVAETDDIREMLLGCVKWVFESTPERGIDPSETKEEIEKKIDAEPDKVSQLAVASITCLGNLVAANPATRKIMWPHLQPHIRALLSYHEQNVSYLSSMVIFNCILEKELKEDLCRFDEVNDIVSDLLTLYLDSEASTEKSVCFVLYTLEFLLCCDGIVSSIWKQISGSQQLLLLDILSNILEEKSGSKCGAISTSTVTFLFGIYKNEADKILLMLTSQFDVNSALVIVRLLNLLCLLAAAEYWRPTLQEDTSLLVTGVSLLQCMNDIGGIEKNGFSRLGLDDLPEGENLAQAEKHPVYGFKRDLIRLIANLVYRHKVNQDKVREMEGITLVLESSQFDARNPAIKEVSIYAIRNLLEGNLENQEVVKKLEYRGSADNQSMQITRENGLVVVHGSSSTTEEQL